MSFFAELKRRHVFKVGLAYVIVAWLLIQIVATVFPILALPDWTVRFITIVIIIGFPIALFLAWAYELTPEGIKPTRDLDNAQNITHDTGRKLNYTIIGLMALAIVFLVLDNYVLNKTPEVTEEPVSSPTVAEGVTPIPAKVIEATPTVSPYSIAVLPFADMSPDKDQDYFADGIAEELLNSLARIKDLEVRGRTSSFYFKGRHEDLHTISDMLNVKYILEGSVRKAGNQVRITVQLIDSITDNHLWSKTYDRSLDDIFAIQEDIAQSVVEALEITLSVGELGRMQGMTGNVAAYEDYLEGRSLSRYVEREYHLRAIEHLERAVTLDPGFGLAWGELADTYTTAANMVISDRADEFNKKAEQAAARAITIAPESLYAVNATANLQMQHREWKEAEETLRKAHSRSPNDYTVNINYAFFLQNVGRPREAIEYFQRAAKAEPLAVFPALWKAFAYEMMGNYDRALQEYQRTKTQKIGDLYVVDTMIMVLAMTTDDRSLLETFMEKSINADNDLNTPVNRSVGSTMLTLLDSPEEGRKTLNELVKDPAYNNQFFRNVVLAVWASYFGDYSLALKLQYQGSEPNIALVYTLWRPIHKPMRQLPGFKDLVTKLGLVDYWRTTGNWGEFCHPVEDDDFECE